MSKTIICLLAILKLVSVTTAGNKQLLDPYDVTVLASHYASVSSYPFAKVVGVFSQVDESSCRCQDEWLPCPLEIREKSVVKFRGYLCARPRRYCCRRKVIPRLSAALQSNLKDLARAASPPDKLLTNAAPQVNFESAATRTEPFSSTGTSSGIIVTGHHNTTGTHNRLDKHQRSLRETDENHDKKSNLAACSCTTPGNCVTLWKAYGELPRAEVKSTLECTGQGEVTCCLGHVLTSQERKTRRNGTKDSSSGPSLWQTAWTGIVSWLGGYIDR